jgi:murein L,D-transpeptidase YafK
VVGLTLSACGGLKPGDGRANVPLKQSVLDKMKGMGSAPGQGTLIRIFKQSNELEIWKRTASGGYKLYDTYEICA